MKKRICSIILALTMAISLLPNIAWASLDDSGFCGATGENLVWYFDYAAKTLTITGSGEMNNYDYISNQSTSHDTPWRYLRGNVVSVIIGEGVTSIGTCAFAGCSKVTSVELPSTITKIGGSAFESCNRLKRIAIPNGVTSIGGKAFYGCNSLTDLTFPPSVINIGGMAFSNSGLINVFIPKNVTLIGECAFDYCPNLKTISVDESNLAYTSIDDVLFNKEMTSLLQYPQAKQNTSYTVPSSVEGIELGAFRDCDNLINITLPDSMAYIGVFGGCHSLTELIIPHGITTFVPFVFQSCPNLTSLTIPKSVSDIGYAPFGFGADGCHLSDIYYEGDESEWSSIQGVEKEIPSTVTIHYNSTGPGGQGGSGEDPIPSKPTWNYDESTKTLTISGRGNISNYTETTHAPWCQYKDDATTIVIESGITSIGDYAFEFFSKVTDVKMPNGLTRIGKCAFQTCGNLSNITIPEGVTNIGKEAFGGCINLKSVALPHSIKNVEELAFQILHDLDDVYYNGDITEWKSINILSGNTPLLDAKNIHYNSIGPNECKVYYSSGKDPEIFSFSLEECIGQTRSTVYSPQLSHMLIALSNAAYNQENLRKSFTSLGFTAQSTDYSSELISYGFAKKTLSNGKNLVLVVVKGSSDLDITNLHPDWHSNLNLGGSAIAGWHWHAGFEKAVNELYSSFAPFVGDFSNTIFVVTGHSRGAAVANLLEIKLFEAKVAQSNVYGYNFACPDVATGVGTSWNWLGEHDNIFNIAAAGDPVSILPGKVIGTALAFTDWGKFGQSRWFASNWDNLMETTLNFDRHRPEEYLTFLRKRPSFLSFKTWEDRVFTFIGNELETILNAGKLYVIRCPVDVTITNSVGNPVASVIGDDINYHSSRFGDVLIFKSGDQKAIYVQGNEPLTIHLTATDSGVMEYTVQTVDYNIGEVLSEKSFSEVALTPGKQMLSMTDVENVTGVGEDVSKVPLYVLDNNGQPELKVLPDGKGTEVPLDTTIYAIIFNANGGTVNPSCAITDSSGKLTNLPTPALTDYKFNGWFTAASGGTRITTETVFNGDTTVYAQWTKSSTNPGGTVNPGNPTYNPGGIYVPPTYNITLPNVSGGKISVSPTSASSGSTVTITTVPNAGYKLTSLTVSDANGKNLELSSKADNQYTFKMPNGKVTITAQFQPINADVSWQNQFIDISENDWYFDAVKFANRNGLMNGVGNGSFAPDAHLSRAMFAQILYNKAGQPSIINSNVFSDVPDGAWFTNAVAWGAANSIVNGHNGQFNPDDPITREQLVLMLWRYEGQPTTSSTLLNFTDAANVSDYALSAMCWAVEKGIIKGKGNGVLDPQGFATRAETAQVLKNYLEN